MKIFVSKNRIFFLLVLALAMSVLNGCSKGGPRELNLASGKKVEYVFEQIVDDQKQTGYFIEIKTEEKIVKQETIEQDVQETWNAFQAGADIEDVEEIIIRYQYIVENVDEKGKSEDVFGLSVFLAEKIENGSWKIDKIA